MNGPSHTVLMGTLTTHVLRSEGDSRNITGPHGADTGGGVDAQTAGWHIVVYTVNDSSSDHL
jgi:hypothetical protein